MSAASVRAGIVRFEEHPYLIDKMGAPMVTSMASYLPDTCEGLNRYVALATPAMEEALAPLRAQPSISSRFPLLLGLPPRRPGLPQGFAEQLGKRLARAEFFTRVEQIETGHAAGLTALHQAIQLLSAEVCEFCLVGGVESYLVPETLEWLDSCSQLKSEANRWGFIPGEGAGFCLLASSAALSRYRLEPLAFVRAVGTATEANRIKTDTVCRGEGLTRAMRGALEGLAPEARLQQIICDMNGERYRADEYAFAALRLGTHLIDPSEAWAPARSWGDVGAASGPLFIVLAIASSLRRYSPGPLCLVWAGSEGGERGAGLLELPLRQRRR